MGCFVGCAEGRAVGARVGAGVVEVSVVAVVLHTCDVYSIVNGVPQSAASVPPISDPPLSAGGSVPQNGTSRFMYVS